MIDDISNIEIDEINELYNNHGIMPFIGLLSLYIIASEIGNWIGDAINNAIF